MTKQETLEKLLKRREDSGGLPKSGFYHTFYIKQDGGKYRQVYSKSESDYTFTGDWCHNSSAVDIMSQMKEIKGGSLLDAGCCDGYFGFMFNGLGAKVSFLDVTSRVPRELFSSLLGHPDNFLHRSVYQCDQLKQYDYIWCQDLICHLLHPMLAIQNFRRICAKKLFLGVDRFDLKELPQPKYMYQDNPEVWPHEAINKIMERGCFYCGSGYTYVFTEGFIIKQLQDSGFKNVRKKFSYTASAANHMKLCGSRIIDVYEAEVDSSTPSRANRQSYTELGLTYGTIV
jgi:hypothetical protein